MTVDDVATGTSPHHRPRQRDGSRRVLESRRRPPLTPNIAAHRLLTSTVNLNPKHALRQPDSPLPRRSLGRSRRLLSAPTGR